MKAVVTMNTDSRPASSGSRGEVGRRRRPLVSSSPTFSSDRASWRVGPAGPPPVAGATWCPTAASCAAVTVVSNPEVDSAVGAG